MLAFKLPRSHDVIKTLSLDSVKPHTVESLDEVVKFNVAVHLIHSGTENSKWLKLYTLSSLSCYLIDIMVFVVQYKWFIDSNADHTNVWMMFVSITMIVFDTLYIVHIFSLKRQLPAYIQEWLWESIFGDILRLTKVIHS